MASNPSDRTLIARLAALERWAREPDRSAATAAARRALDDRYLAQARTLHPDLPERELRIRAENLRSAHAIRAARARWARHRARSGRRADDTAQDLP